MKEIIITVHVFLVVTLIIWWLVTSIKFDIAIREIRAKNYDLWCSIGKLMGFFWIPKEKLEIFSSARARNKLARRYLFRIDKLKAISEGEAGRVRPTGSDRNGT